MQLLDYLTVLRLDGHFTDYEMLLYQKQQQRQVLYVALHPQQNS
jgi:hypothetical protein